MNRVRLAHVYQFALQHYGKSLFYQGNFGQAERLFMRVLQLRLTKGVDSLVASSRFALEVTHRRVAMERRDDSVGICTIMQR